MTRVQSMFKNLRVLYNPYCFLKVRHKVNGSRELFEFHFVVVHLFYHLFSSCSMAATTALGLEGQGAPPGTSRPVVSTSR